ncbi:overproduction-induced pheromone-resistant [Ophidiomyces ophidiicola]|nr:overproduction-induced pheromone-resistant [Ophidiomyces ophidiicola]
MDALPKFSRAPSWQHLFRRCVVGCPERPDPCPVCPNGQECISRPATCESCQRNICVPSTEISPPPAPSGPNAGAIAGGVIGSISIIIVLVVVGWYCMKKRKADKDEDWIPEVTNKQEEEFIAQRRGRMSAVGSIASTVLTRASNVIQIAYIPGVTNRSPPDSPSTIPPVPPIPAAQRHYDQHYFMPGDIRDSVWSSTSDDTRRSIAPSLARSSMATTIYRNNAVVSPIPAQQALRAKAAMVSVKSGLNSPMLSPNDSPTMATPAVPAITVSQMSKANALASKMDKSDKMPTSSIVARTAVARPINVKKPKSKKPTANTADTRDEYPNSSQSQDLTTKFPVDSAKTRESITSTAITLIDDESPTGDQSPFADSKSSTKPLGASSKISEEISQPAGQSIEPQNKSTRRHHNGQPSNQILESTPETASKPAPRNTGPFSDDNEIR